MQTNTTSNMLQFSSKLEYVIDFFKLLFASNSICKQDLIFLTMSKINRFPNSILARKLFKVALVPYCVTFVFLQNFCFSWFWTSNADFDWCILNIEASICSLLLLIKTKDLKLKTTPNYSSQCNVCPRVISQFSLYTLMSNLNLAQIPILNSLL
jgi:hypothetical protein